MIEFATGPGFFKVELDRALALVDDAVNVKEIDDARAQQQLADAKAELARVEAGESKADRWQLEQRQARREPARRLRRTTGGSGPGRARPAAAALAARGSPGLLALSSGRAPRSAVSPPGDRETRFTWLGGVRYSERTWKSFEATATRRKNAKEPASRPGSRLLGSIRDDERDDRQTDSTPCSGAHRRARRRLGTMLQGLELGEVDFRGERFRDHPRDLRATRTCSTSRGPTSYSTSTARTRRRGGRHDDEHVHRDEHRAGGVRAQAPSTT